MTKIAPRSAVAPSPAEGGNGGLYDEDFVRWLDRQVALIRSHRLEELDLDNLAEELEDMGKSRRLELRSRLEVLLAHLLKYEFQPAMRSGSWRGTIVEQRTRIENILEENPSLRALLDQLADDPKLYANALRQAAAETGLSARSLPEANPYGRDAVDQGFWPGEDPHPDLG